MAKIICDAVPFCYGPIAKLLSIANLLKKSKHELVLLEFGTSAQLARKEEFNKIIKCNTENLRELSKNKGLFEKSDLLISVMNPLSISFAKRYNLKKVYVDSLFWMWDSIPNELNDVDSYLIQNFPGVKRNFERIGEAIRNPEFVGPIINTPKGKHKKKNQLLINFGGMESHLVKVGVNSFYPYFMTEILINSLKGNKFDRVLVSGGKRVIEILKNRYEDGSNIRFCPLSHPGFLKELASSRLFMTSPGLTGSFEAFDMKIPTVFLPPQNYSQFLNLKTFRAQGIADYSIHWIDYYPDKDIKENENEAEGVKKVLGCINKFQNDSFAKEDIGRKLARFFESNPPVSLARRQNDFLKSLGGNGAVRVVNKINELVR